VTGPCGSSGSPSSTRITHWTHDEELSCCSCPSGLSLRVLDLRSFNVRELLFNRL
jgi:hypothetical protein